MNKDKNAVERDFLERIGFNPYSFSSDFMSRQIYKLALTFNKNGTEDQRSINEFSFEVSLLFKEIQDALDLCDRTIFSMRKQYKMDELDFLYEYCEHLERLIKGNEMSVKPKEPTCSNCEKLDHSINLYASSLMASEFFLTEARKEIADLKAKLILATLKKDKKDE